MKSFIQEVKRDLDEELFHLPKSPRRQLALLLISLAAGIIVGFITPLQIFSFLWIVATLLIGIGISINPRSWFLIACGVLCFGLGRGGEYGNFHASMRDAVGTEVTMTGTVSGFSRAQAATSRFSVDVSELNSNKISFPLRVTSATAIERGSRVRLRCTLRERGWSYECRGGNVEFLSGPPSYIQALNILRAATYERVAAYLSPDRAALLAGMVYGGDDALPVATRDAFRAAGLSHLVAVSGANLALVTVMLYGFLTAFWLPRRKAALVSLGILGITVLFVGLDPSVVRAGIMGSLILIGYLLGRPRSSGNALLLAAVLMMFANPWMMFDLGFLLSVSATAGLMLLSSKIEQRILFIPEFGSIRGAVALALSAWLATMPVLALTLGSVQLVSPIANIFAAPIAAMIFLLGVAFCFVAWIPFLGSLLAPILGFLLDTLRFIAALFAGVPFGTTKHVPVVTIAVIASLVMMIWLIRSKNTESSLPIRAR